MDKYWLIFILLTVLISLFFFFRLITLFNKYKKLKLQETPSFKASKYQSQLPGNYLIMPIYISEKDTNPNLIKLKTTYNKVVKIWWYFMGVVVISILTGIILGKFIE